MKITYQEIVEINRYILKNGIRSEYNTWVIDNANSEFEFEAVKDEQFTFSVAKIRGLSWVFYCVKNSNVIIDTHEITYEDKNKIEKEIKYLLLKTKTKSYWEKRIKVIKQ